MGLEKLKSAFSNIVVKKKTSIENIESEFQTGPVHEKNDGIYNPVDLSTMTSEFQSGPAHSQNDGVYNPGMPESSEFQSGPAHPQNDGVYNPGMPESSEFQSGPVHPKNDGIYNPISSDELANKSSEFQSGPDYNPPEPTPSLTIFTSPPYPGTPIQFIQSDLDDTSDSTWEPIGEGGASLLLQEDFPLLNTMQRFNFVDSNSEPVTDLYKSYTYDPRTPRPPHQNITKNGYAGTRFNQIGLLGDAGSGIGGIFNTDGLQGNKYSTAWTVINTPTMDEIMTNGNWGKGYTIQSTYMSQYNLAQSNELIRYYQDGQVNNDAASWYSGGGQPGIMPPNDYVPLLPSNNANTRTVELDGVHIQANELRDTGGWEALYNADGSSKGVGYSYPNVDQSRLRYGATNKGKRGDEPYITFDIGDDRLGDDSRTMPWKHGKADVKRIAKFLGSPSGMYHFLKENILGQMAHDQGIKYRRNYTGLGTLFATAGMGLFPGGGAGMPLQIQRNEVQDWFTSLYNNDYETYLREHPSGSSIYRKAVVPKGKSGVDEGLHLVNELEEGRSAGTYDETFGDELKDKPRWINAARNVNTSLRDYDPMTIMPLTPSKEERTLQEEEKRGMPFYFIDMRHGTQITFRAFLEGLTENYSPNWNTLDYPGRSEPVYTYNRAERDVSFTMKAFGGNVVEEAAIWKKVNALASLVYPQYAAEVASYSYKMRMKPPFCKLRIGDLFGNAANGGQLGFIKSLSITTPESSPWNTIPTLRKPKFITAAITFQCIGYGAPSSLTQFYGSV